MVKDGFRVTVQVRILGVVWIRARIRAKFGFIYSELAAEIKSREGDIH